VPSPATNALLYPPIEARRHGRLKVDDLHDLYWEECGNPDGIPVLFLHGGPGAGISTDHRRFFDPSAYRAVLFDQRGSGKSTPLGEWRQNTTALLIDDIERLRKLLGIDRWLVFGGSWGSTLALAYGEAHPERCLGFVLRGIYFGSRAENDWWINGQGLFFPEVHRRFVEAIPSEERADLLQAYARRMFDDDPAVHTPAVRAWSRYEGACLNLIPDPSVEDAFGELAVALGLGRLECHYFLHDCFLEDGQILRDLDRVRRLPAVIVQGRYDIVCPPRTAWSLHDAWPAAVFTVVPDAGHSAFETGIARELVAALDRFKISRRFDR
jgi:proline iminopeptidase